MIQSLLYWGLKLYVIDCVIDKTITLVKNYINHQIWNERILNDLSNTLNNTIAPSRK